MNTSRSRQSVTYVTTVTAATVVGLALFGGVRSANAQPTCSISPGSVVYAEQCSGADAGAKIAQALSVLGTTTSGTVDARGLHTNLTINTPLIVGTAWSASVKLLLGPGRWTVSAPITLNMQSTLAGAPLGTTVGGYDLTATTLKAADNANLDSVVRLGDGTSPGGFGAVVEDIAIDGNKAANGTSASGATLWIRGGRADLSRVTVQNAAGDGIRIEATAAVSSCCAKISKVVSLASGASNLRIHGYDATNNANDTWIVESEFGGGQYGIKLEHAAALRMSTSDVSGNQVGIWTDWSSGNLILTNNQFADQVGHDIQTSAGSAHVITGNEFLGSNYRQAGQSCMQIWSSNISVVSGNTILMSGAASTLAYGIQFIGGSNNLASGNVITGGAAGTGIVGASNSSGGLTPQQLNITP